jgi:hypothetical protein
MTGTSGTNGMSEQEQRLAELLKRAVPEPPYQLSAEEITMRLVDRSRRSWMVPALAAAAVMIIGASIGAVAATRPDSAAPKAPVAAQGTLPAQAPSPQPISPGCHDAAAPSPSPSLRVVGGMVTVPAVTGLRLARAEQVVQQAGLLAAVVVAPAHGAPAGTVLSERPAEGTRAPRYTPVLLTVAAQAGRAQPTTPTATPSPAATPVPSPTGAAVPSAAPVPSPTCSASATPVPSASPIEVPSVAPTPEPSASPVGVPSVAPTPVPSASPVGAPTPVPTRAAGVTVPNVVGMQEAQAQSVLQLAGFNVLVFPNAPEPSGRPKGTVFKQSPAAGTLLARGSTVTIYG